MSPADARAIHTYLISLASCRELIKCAELLPYKLPTVGRHARPHNSLVSLSPWLIILWTSTNNFKISLHTGAASLNDSSARQDQENAIVCTYIVYNSSRNMTVKQTIEIKVPFSFRWNALEDVKRKRQAHADNETRYKRSLATAPIKSKKENRTVKIHTTQSRLIAACAGERAAHKTRSGKLSLREQRSSRASARLSNFSVDSRARARESEAWKFKSTGSLSARSSQLSPTIPGRRVGDR